MVGWWGLPGKWERKILHLCIKRKKNWVDVVTNQKQFSCQQIHHFINCLINSKPNTIWHLRLVYINLLYLLRKWSGTCLHTNKYVEKNLPLFLKDTFVSSLSKKMLKAIIQRIRDFLPFHVPFILWAFIYLLMAKAYLCKNEICIAKAGANLTFLFC